MSSTLLRTFSKHSWTGEPIVVPPRAHPHNGFRDKHSAINTHDSSTPVTELDRISFDASGLPFTPIQSATTEVAASVKEAGGEKGRREKQKYRIVLAAIFWCFFTLGLNDGSTGPLLPVYQEYYGINFLTVSMIFISNCMGCLTSAFLNVLISRRVAFSKILILATVLQITGYAILSPAAGFPLMCVAFFINGMGMSLLNAQCNSLLSMLHNSTAMGFAHASYGVGALIAPLISTQFARLYIDSHTSTNPGSGKWALHYTVLLVAALSDLISFVVLLKGRGYDEILSEMGAPAQEHEEVELTRAAAPAPEESVVEVGGTSGDEGGESETMSRKARDSSSFTMVLKQVHVHILAAFVFIYVGLEVTIGGWIVTFMINERGGGASAGYISSGFFGGLALGRVSLLWVNKKLGERNAIFLYIAIGIALEMVIWFVPSLIGDAVAISLVGMVLGPFYPIVMSQAGRIIPRKVLSGSIGWIAGFGQSGSAVLPFITGALANKFGIIALQPLIVAMMAAMATLWFTVPSITKRRE